MNSSAPKRRLDVRQEAPQRVSGKRAAPRRQATSRRALRPTPAMAGAFVLIVAGFGAAVVGGATDGDPLSANKYQTISQNYVGPDAAGDAGQVDVSRSFDRRVVEKQAKAQAQQVLVAQADLAKKVTKQTGLNEANQWVLPVTGYQLTARFGQRSGLWTTVHTGLDFAGPSGSTIVSVAAGTVKSTGYEGSYGNRTVITLRDGTDIWYAHQSRIAVQPGDVVIPGQTIGYSGSTGNVTGPHLHLEVHPNGGAAVDPFPELVKHEVNP